jgi:hypothetical protein
MYIRYVTESDYLPIIEIVNDWWGGRSMAENRDGIPVVRNYDGKGRDRVLFIKKLSLDTVTPS